MFNSEEREKKRFFKKMKWLELKGVVKRIIVPYDENYCNALRNTYIFGLPVYFYIEYTLPNPGLGKCLDRSLYMFLCFDDALWVNADLKDLEYKFGKDNAIHGWVEKDGYVYDPSYRLRFEKDYYYKLYQPSNIVKFTMDEYINTSPYNEQFCRSVKSHTLDSYREGGDSRIELLSVIPIVKDIADKIGNPKFKDDLNQYLSDIGYDEESLQNEFEKLCRDSFSKRNIQS